MAHYRPQPLPVWFEWPEPELGDEQLSLFSRPLLSLLPHLRVSRDELERWYDEGWLTIPVAYDDLVDPIRGPTVMEIVFVRDLVRSGLSDIEVSACLAALPPPYSYDPARVVFNPVHGWVVVAPIFRPPVFDEPDENRRFLLWLEHLREEEALSLLLRLRAQITDHIDALYVAHAIRQDPDQ